MNDNLVHTFSTIYKDQIWSSAGLGSGTGSSLELTVETRKILSKFIIDHGIRSMIDAPCGKMNWISKVLSEIDGEFEYFGIDIVASVINWVRMVYQNSLFSKITFDFRVLDITKEVIMVKCDLIHCRDTLQHLPMSDIVSALENFSKVDFKWIMIGSYCGIGQNVDIVPGGYFSINLLDAPFLMDGYYRMEGEKTNLVSDEPEKFYLIYESANYKKINFDEMRIRVNKFIRKI